MPIGDIKINKLSIGELDLSSAEEASHSGFNIYENILNPYGPACDINIIDHSEALSNNKISGSYDKDIDIDFSLQDLNLGRVSFKFKMFRNKDLNNMAENDIGSAKAKQYLLKGVSAEYLNAQGNYCQKSYNDLTSNMVKDILQTNFKTDKQIEIKEPTRGKRRIITNNDHPLKTLEKLDNEHVSSENESSCYVCYQEHENGNGKYVFSTFEKLFDQPVVASFKETTINDTNPLDLQSKQYSIIWKNVSDSFFSGSRPMSQASEQTLNLTTHGVVSTRPKQTEYKTADGKGKTVYKAKASYSTEYPVKYIHDKANNKQEHSTSEAKKKKIEFLSHIAQNSAEIEIIGNPKVKLGSMIELQFLAGSAINPSSKEKQFNGKALVVAIRHKIKPAGETPRYTMILRVVKASYKEGNSDNA